MKRFSCLSLASSFVAALLIFSPSISRANVINGAPPSYKDGPVFYEIDWEYYTDKENLDLMHDGKVMLGILGTESIEGFDWVKHSTRKDNSFFVRMENFWYLLPLIDSDKPRDREFVRQWITGWLQVHETNEAPNFGSKDAMSVGIRALTFTWYLRKMHLREEPEDELVARIKRSLAWHQQYLKTRYQPVSNHGFWEAMGLFETTRVHPDSAVVRLALDRIVEMVGISVSEKGLHKEHSPAYHFWIWNWIKQFKDYFESMDDLEWSGFEILAAAEKRMRWATYYLYDHNRNMPQIGDTDAKTLKKREAPARRREHRYRAVLFDEQAGLAIYKDPVRFRRGRYLVFCIQNTDHRPKLHYHYHNDALAVYYAHDGEVILSDQGRYSYTADHVRRFYQSNSAHNTVSSVKLLGRTGPMSNLNHDVWWREEDDRVLFGASFARDTVTRLVEISKRGTDVGVFDTILDNGEYVVLWNIGPDVASLEGLSRTLGPSDSTRHYSWRLTTHKGRRFILNIEVVGDCPEGEAEVELIEGQKKPLLGWYSPGYDVSIPSRLIKINLKVNERSHVATRIFKEGH